MQNPVLLDSTQMISNEQKKVSYRHPCGTLLCYDGGPYNELTKLESSNPNLKICRLFIYTAAAAALKQQ